MVRKAILECSIVNYRTCPMDELVVELQAITDHGDFIKAAKYFISRFHNGEYISKADHNKALREAQYDAHQSGYDEGYRMAYAECEEAI